MEIRFSCLSRLNDPHECMRRTSRHFSSDDDSDARIFQKANVIRMNDLKTFCGSAIIGDNDLLNCKSSHISPMWSHYAKLYAREPSRRGCVLIFDLNLLLDDLVGQKANIVKNDFVQYVPYGEIISGNVARFSGSPSDEAVRSEIHRGAKDLWFKKQDQWSYESEYRVLIDSPDQEYTCFNFSRSLVGIAIDCASFNELPEEQAAVIKATRTPLICTYYRPETGKYGTNLLPKDRCSDL
jgi:hypothetical protein